MSKLVFVHSIPRPSALGISDWTNNSSGIKLKKIKVGKTRDSLMAVYSHKVGGLANYISYTPWIRDGEQVKDPQTGRGLTLQDYMEEKWNKPKGYFTNRAWREGDSLDTDKMTYFQTKSWKFNDGSTVFDLSKMDDEMGYYVCLASSLIANSEKEWRSHKWPKAEYYIAIENEGEEIKYQRTQIKSKAFAILHDPSITEEDKRKMAVLLNLFSARTSPTPQNLHNTLFNYIDTSDYNPGSNIDKFVSLHTLLNSPHGREQFEARFILQKAIDYRVVYEKAGTYTWNRPNHPLVMGERIEEAVEFILNPKKAKEVEEILASLK